jgi:hypothetical protein
MSNASDDYDDLDILTTSRLFSAFLIKSGFISCMFFLAWIFACSITTVFDEGHQHNGLITLRDHTIWFCVGVKDGPAKGMECTRRYRCRYLLRVQLEMKCC